MVCFFTFLFHLFFQVSWAGIEMQERPRQRVVLLTSVDSSQFKWILFSPSLKNTLPHLESLFREKFEKLNYEIEIKAGADQFDLYQALHHPRNVAVFWVSHAAYGSGPDSLTGVSQIVDSQGYDVTPVFEKIHPNLRFLAVIGCSSKSVLNSLPEFQPKSKATPLAELKVFTFDKKVEATKGLKAAMKESLQVLQDPRVQSGYDAPCEKVRGFHLNVMRSFNLSKNWKRKYDIEPLRPAVRIMAGQRLLGVLPKGSQSEGNQVEKGQKADFFFSATADVNDLPKILHIDSGANDRLMFRKLTRLLDVGNFQLFFPKDLAEMGEVDLWKRVTLPNHQPLGTSTQLYRISANWADELQRASMERVLERALGTESEYSCEPMPAHSSLAE